MYWRGLLIVLLVAACDDGGEGSSSINVTMECNSATDCANQTADGKPYIFVLLAPNSTCLTHLPNEVLGYVIGTTACSPGGCVSAGSQFVDSIIVQNPIDVPAADIYPMYSFIDTNQDNLLTLGEPYFCDMFGNWNGISQNVVITGDR